MTRLISLIRAKSFSGFDSKLASSDFNAAMDSSTYSLNEISSCCFGLSSFSIFPPRQKMSNNAKTRAHIFGLLLSVRKIVRESIKQQSEYCEWYYNSCSLVNKPSPVNRVIPPLKPAKTIRPVIQPTLPTTHSTRERTANSSENPLINKVPLKESNVPSTRIGRLMGYGG